MDNSADTNAAIWQSQEIVANWVKEADAQERKRTSQRRLMADLLPFGDNEEFTFLDLGAGPGAASRAILERHPRSLAILADFSAEMMRAGDSTPININLSDGQVLRFSCTALPDGGRMLSYTPVTELVRHTDDPAYAEHFRAMRGKQLHSPFPGLRAAE